MDAIGFNGGYDSDGNFNFKHTLFLLNGDTENGRSKFNLDCEVRVCEKNETDSVCDQAISRCNQ